MLLPAVQPHSGGIGSASTTWETRCKTTSSRFGAATTGASLTGVLPQPDAIPADNAAALKSLRGFMTLETHLNGQPLTATARIRHNATGSGALTARSSSSLSALTPAWSSTFFDTKMGTLLPMASAMASEGRASNLMISSPRFSTTVPM